MNARLPAHVTLRLADHVWNLRTKRGFRELAPAIYESANRFGLRIVEFSLQGNHIHLIIEAPDTRAMSSGIQGLSIRIARRLNHMMDKHGKVFADRFHSRVLRTPPEVRRAREYVLGNHAHHAAQRGKVVSSAPDPFSSAGYFDSHVYFEICIELEWPVGEAGPPRLELRPRTWLLKQERKSDDPSTA